ncbi:MAG: hypothetical protein LKE37_09575 [Atopobiaceae bacterium]|jgi:alpha-tubulin suppressor-like RCC1 family protein|nr:hypothetical protein [Atopobiaceae bacterium]
MSDKETSGGAGLLAWVRGHRPLAVALAAALACAVAWRALAPGPSPAELAEGRASAAALAGRVSADVHDVVAIRPDGTVFVSSRDGVPAEVSGWDDVTQVATGGHRAFVALRSDGTVVSAGRWWDFAERQDDPTSSWTDVASIATCSGTTYGVRSDGTVVSAGKLSSENGGHAGFWSGVSSVVTSAGWGDSFVLAVTSDGRLLEASDPSSPESQFSAAAASAAPVASAAISEDAVVAVSESGTVWHYSFGDGDWMAPLDSVTGAVQAAAGERQFAVLRADGTVVALSSDGATYDVSGWRGVVRVACGYDSVYGLTEGGDVLDCTAGGRSHTRRRRCSAVYANGRFSPLTLGEDGTLVWDDGDERVQL